MTLLKIICVIVVVAVAAYCFYAAFNGLFPFGGGDGDGFGVVSLIDPKDITEPDSVSEPPLVIEINENRIIYNEDEISFDELEIIIKKYGNDEYGWTIRDVYRADKDTFDKVRGLLANNDIFFAEE